MSRDMRNCNGGKARERDEVPLWTRRMRKIMSSHEAKWKTEYNNLNLARKAIYKIL